MKKRRTISVVPVAIAWMIIFLHAVIPHNHHPEHQDNCTMMVHCCHEADTSKPEKELYSEPGNHNHSLICHYDSGQFHPLDNNATLFAETGSLATLYQGGDNSAIAAANQPFIKRFPNHTHNRRGPPRLIG